MFTNASLIRLEPIVRAAVLLRVPRAALWGIGWTSSSSSSSSSSSDQQHPPPPCPVQPDESSLHHPHHHQHHAHLSPLARKAAHAKSLLSRRQHEQQHQHQLDQTTVEAAFDEHDPNEEMDRLILRKVHDDNDNDEDVHDQQTKWALEKQLLCRRPADDSEWMIEQAKEAVRSTNEFVLRQQVLKKAGAQAEADDVVIPQEDQRRALFDLVHEAAFLSFEDENEQAKSLLEYLHDKPFEQPLNLQPHSSDNNLAEGERKLEDIE